MAVEDRWHRKDGTRTKAYGQGMRWRVRWRGRDSKSFQHKTAAERYLLKLRSEVRRPESDVTVGELLDRWLSTKQKLSESGRRNCRLAADRVRAAWGDASASEVTRPAVREWLAGLDGSASKQRKTFQALSGALAIATEEEVIAANPCIGVKQPGERARAARYLTPEQVAELAGAAGRDGPLVYLLATSGLRIGEACALDVGDVRGSMLRVRSEDVGARKGDARDVAIPDWVVAMLDLDRPADAPLFVGTRGARLVPHSWRKRFYGATKRAGLDGVRPHDLRHTAVSLAAKSGVREKVVQRMVGHKRPMMTGRYSHLFESELEPAATAIGGLFPGQLQGNSDRESCPQGNTKRHYSTLFDTTGHYDQGVESPSRQAESGSD